MKEAIRSNGSNNPARRGSGTRRKRSTCSICSRPTWFDSVSLMEPEDVPEPRQSWILCQDCYRMLVEEMRRSPIRSSLRLRVAMGIVAAERWPKAYLTENISSSRDQRRIIFIAWVFVAAMLFHLSLIVALAFLHS